jgi:hypothetical protein
MRLAAPLVVAIYVALSLLTFDRVDEDAFIYFRLAENLAAGHGYVFNPGGPPIESGSSPLWLLLLVPLAGLPGELVTAAKLLGIVFGAASLLLTLRLGERLIDDPWARHAPALMVAISPVFVTWCQVGLETALHATAVLWMAWALTGKRRSSAWALPACALFVSRPEGVALYLALVPVFLAAKVRLETLVRPALAVMAFALAVLLARIVYFHDVVPNPFYCKMQVSTEYGPVRLHDAFVTQHLYVLLAPLLAVVWRRTFWSQELIAIGSLLVLVLAWNVTVFEHFGSLRHLVPALPLLFLVIVHGFACLAALVPARRTALLRALCAASLVVVAPVRGANELSSAQMVTNPIATAAHELAASPLRYLRMVGDKIRSPSTTPPVPPLHAYSIAHNPQARVGEFIARNYPPGTVVIYDQMGQTPYYAGSDHVFVDSFGLTDRATGLYVFSGRVRKSRALRIYDRVIGGALRWLFPGDKRDYSESEIADYLFERNAEVIMIHKLVVDFAPEHATRLVGVDPRIHDRYRHRLDLSRWIALHERTDLPRREVVDPEGLVLPDPSREADSSS